jgi:putative hemolysin
MIAIILLMLIGLLLSAFFSGSETGLYRAARPRILMDALSGDRISRGLLWLANNPTLFVATALIGNNLANYVTSFAVVLAVEYLPFTRHLWIEIAAPIALAPVLFVYGELLPKQMFYHAPNRLLRRCGPLLLFFSVLFVPLSALLWLLGLVLSRLGGETPLRVQRSLARKELRQLMEEGQEAGVLRPSQRQLAQNLIAEGTLPVRRHAHPLNRVVVVPPGASRKDAQNVARRYAASILLCATKPQEHPSGYVRAAELYLGVQQELPQLHALPIIAEDEPIVAAVIHLRSRGDDAALIANRSGDVVGVVFTAELAAAMMGGVRQD